MSIEAGRRLEKYWEETGANHGRSARQTTTRLSSRQSEPLANHRRRRRADARHRRRLIFHLEEGRRLRISGMCSLASLIVILTMFGWWRDVIKEAHEGYETPVVQLHLRYGMILFIASEVMFFVAWFWAYFDAALYPDDAITYARTQVLGGQWPPIPSADTDIAGLGWFAHTFNPWGSAARQYADPAHLRHDGDLGASRAAAKQPPRSGASALPAPSCSASCSPPARPMSTCMPVSASPTTSMARPSSWRPASTASTSSSAPSS